MLVFINMKRAIDIPICRIIKTITVVIVPKALFALLFTTIFILELSLHELSTAICYAWAGSFDEKTK
jgi:hypothetical protein